MPISSLGPQENLKRLCNHSLHKRKRESKLREVKSLTQAHTASKWYSRNSHSGSVTQKPFTDSQGQGLSPGALAQVCGLPEAASPGGHQPAVSPQATLQGQPPQCPLKPL